MKILTFIHSFDPGGVERIALRLVRDWRARGIAAPLFVGRAEGAMLGDVGAGLEFSVPRQPRGGSAWFETFWMIAKLPGAIRREQPDVLFCAGNTYTVVAFFMRWLLPFSCPPILVKISNELEWAHQGRFARFWYRIWLWLQGRAFDRLVAMEEAMVPQIERYLHVASHRVGVVPDPALTQDLLDTLAEAPPAAWLPHEGRRFVAVGRLVAQKNLPLLLRAFAAGGTPADRLDFIGEGPDRAALDALVAALGLEGRVRFLGYRPEPALDLPVYHALLLSSDFEGVPAVLLEALAAGLPVIATACSPSVVSLLGEGRFGTLVAPGDETGFAAALARFVPGGQDRVMSFAQACRFTTDVAGPAYLAEAARIAGKPAPVAAPAPPEPVAEPSPGLANLQPVHAPVT